ncbi:MAG: hypothetical protein EA391_15135 [Balneolaceae bacterium]|nr:MAG: hypothetical protein EA391_15135 [Balneolaceae bacterium]
MFNSKRVLQTIAALLILPFLVLSCSDNTTAPIDEGPPPPAFNIASIVVQLQGGDQGLQFFASANVDVTLGRVNITPPVGNDFVFNANNNLWLSEEQIALQNPNEGYLRISGTWRFRFVGNHSPGGERFDVRQQITVGAKELPNIIE